MKRLLRSFSLLLLCALVLLQAAPFASASGKTFSDVKPGDWFYDSVMEAAERGLMNGMTETEFLPEETTSRAMLVTILYRLSGSPKSADGASFPDVVPGSWYADAAAWGAEQKLVLGFEDGTFRPEDEITREQTALILQRYAAYCGKDVTQSASLDGFADPAEVSSWALDAMAWAVGCGLVGGKGSGSALLLAPQASTTRAEMATLICRACRLLAQEESFTARGYTIGYIPLDNRAVNDMRPVWLGESCGLRIRMPDESLYATRMDNQSANPNGTTFGDRAALLQWLKDNEAQCDAFVISLDQLLSGGLVSSRSLNGTDLTFEFEVIDYIAELSTRKPVYVFDTVVRLASTVGYQGLGFEEYSLFRSYGAVARKALTGDELTVENICKGYRYGVDGEKIPTTLSEEKLENYHLARARKLRLAERMLQKSDSLAAFWIGVDDSAPNGSIQTNEIAFLRSRLGTNGLLFCAADELGMMGVARAYLDACAWQPTLAVRYFGGNEDSYADIYDNTTLREAVTYHVDALGCRQTASGGDADVLVLTRGASAQDQAAFFAAWKENDAAGRLTIVLDASADRSTPEQTAQAICLGSLLGYSSWGTAGNAIGIGLSMGVTRLAWLTCETDPQAADNEMFARELVFAFVKDVAYYCSCRDKVAEITPEGIETAVLSDPVTQMILARFAGAALTASKSGEKYTVGTPKLTDFSAPFARTYEIDFQIEFE